MSKKKYREVVIDMFKDNYSAYSIHLKTGLSFKEITSYIRDSEELKARHKSALAREKELQEV